MSVDYWEDDYDEDDYDSHYGLRDYERDDYLDDDWDYWYDTSEGPTIPAWRVTLLSLRYRVKQPFIFLHRRFTRCKDCGKWGTVDDDYCDQHQPIPF